MILEVSIVVGSELNSCVSFVHFLSESKGVKIARSGVFILSVYLDW